MQTTNDDRQVVTDARLRTPMVSLGVVSEMQPPPTRNDNLTETGRFQASQVPGEQSIGILLLPVTMVTFATHKLCAQSLYMELGRPYRGVMSRTTSCPKVVFGPRPKERDYRRFSTRFV